MYYAKNNTTGSKSGALASGVIPSTNNVESFTATELQLWLSFIRDRNLSAQQKRALLRIGNNNLDLFDAHPNIDAELSHKITTTDMSLSSVVDMDVDWLGKEGNYLITYYDQHYPALLKQINDPPIALFARGNLSQLEFPCLSMVGSRRPTPVGRKMAIQLAQQLSALGICVVSGMALGIDGASHEGALEAGGATIAVMASGLDCIYPHQHRKLFDDISSNGCVVSEYPLGMQPTRYSFPMRNRIVSGLSMGTIIVEAANKSGTLLTARATLEQDRELMVVPGSALSKQYEGSHRLIAQGAAIVTCCEDVLRELKQPLREKMKEEVSLETSPIKNDSINQQDRMSIKLMSYLSAESCSLDELIQNSGLTSAEVSSMLLALEVDELVAICDDGGYVRLD